MQTKASLRGIKERIILHRLLGISCASLAVFVLAFILVPTLISEASATDDVSAGVRWGSVSLTLDPDVAATEAAADPAVEQALSTHGDINFGEMVPSSKAGDNYGTLKVLKKTIGITSTGKYYSVFISTNSATNSLNFSGSETVANIPAVTSDGTNDGSWDEPAQLKGNGWGFATPGTPVETSTSTSASPTYPSFGLTRAEFLAPGIAVLMDTQIIKEAGNTEAKNTLYNNTRWAAVPVKSAPQQIWKAEANSINGFGSYYNSNDVLVTGDTTNNTFDIYYALMVNTNTLAGTYSNQIVYTALASATAIDQVSTNMVISTNIGGQGEPETVWFDLSDSATSITEDDITIALVPHKHLVAANYMELNNQTFTLDKLGHDIDYYATTYGTCAITANSLTISDGTDGTISHLDCTMPQLIVANYTMWPEEGNDSYGVGSFDLWMSIDNYDYNYITKTEYNNNTYIPAFVYTGLQSKYSFGQISVDTDEDGIGDISVQNDPRADLTDVASYDKNKIIKTMQEINPRICGLTRRWNNQTGEDARILNFRGMTVTQSTDVNFHAALGRGTFSLEDERDGKTYLVRRLADGNCWMVQNLDLNLEAVANGDITLDNTNTGLNTKTSWAPDPTTVTSEFKNSTTARTHDNGLEYLYYDTTNEDYNIAIDSEYVVAHGSQYAGDYYNWYAATAEAEIGEDSITHDSICPYGWRLPGGVSSTTVDGTFRRLIYGIYDIDPTMGNYTGLEKMLSIPLSFIYTGDFSNVTAGSRTSRGLYATDRQYSAEATTNTLPVDFYRSSANLYVPGSAAKYVGTAIRCVARK